MGIIAKVTCKTFGAQFAVFAETKAEIAAAFNLGTLHCIPDAHVGQTSFQAAKVCYSPVKGTSDICNFPASEKAECLSFEEVKEYPKEFEEYGSFSEKLFARCTGCGKHVLVEDLRKVHGTCDACSNGEFCWECIQKPCIACEN